MSSKKSLREWESRTKSPAFWIATWFGVGMLKPAPGTWGSLAALPVALLFLWVLSTIDSMMTFDAFLGYFLAMIVPIFLGGMIAIKKIEAETGIHDAPEIVIDEVVGQLIAFAMLMVTMYFYRYDNYIVLDALVAYAIHLALFRFFDILKPWPISFLDRRVKGAFGVMIDDVLAGVFALICSAVLIFMGFTGI